MKIIIPEAKNEVNVVVAVGTNPLHGKYMVVHLKFSV